MNGTKKARFTKVLEKKRAELLIFKCFTGKKAEPVIRVNNTCWWIRGYASDLAAYATKAAPLPGREAVTGAVHGDTGNSMWIKQGLDVVPDP